MSGPRVGADGAPEPDRRHRGVRGRPWRDPARGPGLRPQRRRRRDQRHRRPPGPRRHRHARPAGERQGGRSSTRCRASAPRCSTPTTARRADGAPLRRAGHLLHDADASRQEGFDRVDGHGGRGGAAMVLQQTDRGRAARPAHGRPRRCRSSTRTSSRRRSRPGAHERRQRPGGCGRRLGRRAPTCTTSARACARSPPPSSRRRAASTMLDVAGTRSSSTTATTSTACASWPSS